MEWKAKFKQLTSRVGNQFSSLSSRERFLVGGSCAIVLLFLCSYIIFDTVTPKFSDQSKRLEQLEKQARKLPDLLEEYQQLTSQKARMENRFNSSNPDLDGTSYLEGLIQKHTSNVQYLQINNSGLPTDLGNRFIQERFNVSFRTSEIKHVVEFLRRAVHSEQPLLVTSLDLERKGNTLGVKIELSSIRRKAGV